MPKNYFQLSDAIKIASVLRYYFCEQSLYCPCGKHMESFWSTFGLFSLEVNCEKKRYNPLQALIDHSNAKNDFQYQLIYQFLLLV